MKRTGMLFAFMAAGLVAISQQAIVKISGTRLAYPLFNHWIKEYSKTHPGVSFMVKSGMPADSSDLLIASYAVQPGELNPGKQLIPVSRYVQLPVVNSERKDLRELQQKGFSSLAFQQVYFTDHRNDNPQVYTNLFTVYTREKPACATKAFAGHFGNQTTGIHGVGVPGDDLTLLNAVKKDTYAISYNNLGFIYNLETRKVTDSIAVVPIDLNENGKIDQDENIYNTVDEVVDFAERTNSSKLIIENVNVIVNKDFINAAAKDFLTWIIKQGQQYNHETGFLRLRESQIEDGSAILATTDDGDILDSLYGKQN